MNQSQIIVEANSIEQSIAQEAEFEIWRSIRDDTRRRLTVAITVGFLYFLAALAVGAYLILTVAEVGRETVFLKDWEPERIDVVWLTQIALGYGGLALVAVIGYALTLMLIRDKLPPWLCRIVGAMPWIGSTIGIVSMGEFCQSIYQSILRRQTYSDAFAQASMVVGDARLRRWSGNSSKRIESGNSLVSVFQSSPIQDQPLSAVTAFVAKELSVNESVRVWHHATAECHLLAQSRLARTTLVISITCLLASVLIAIFAMFLSGMLMRVLLQGLTY